MRDNIKIHGEEDRKLQQSNFIENKNILNKSGLGIPL